MDVKSIKSDVEGGQFEDKATVPMRCLITRIEELEGEAAELCCEVCAVNLTPSGAMDGSLSCADCAANWTRERERREAERDGLRALLDARNDHTAEEVGYAAVLTRAEAAEAVAVDWQAAAESGDEGWPDCSPEHHRPWCRRAREPSGE